MGNENAAAAGPGNLSRRSSHRKSIAVFLNRQKAIKKGKGILQNNENDKTKCQFHGSKKNNFSKEDIKDMLMNDLDEINRGIYF